MIFTKTYQVYKRTNGKGTATLMKNFGKTGKNPFRLVNSAF